MRRKRPRRPAKGIVEKPEPSVPPSTPTFIGRYIIQPEIFNHLGALKPGSGNEIQLTDGLAKLIDDGRPFHGLRFTGRRFDCGDKIGFLHANLAFALAREDIAPELRKILSEYY